MFHRNLPVRVDSTPSSFKFEKKVFSLHPYVYTVIYLHVELWLTYKTTTHRLILGCKVTPDMQTEWKLTEKNNTRLTKNAKLMQI